MYRILLPICNTLAQIPRLAENPALRSYIDDGWGSADGLSREILADFFRHGFDGSGAGNYFDAGKCAVCLLPERRSCLLLRRRRSVALLTSML